MAGGCSGQSAAQGITGQATKSARRSSCKATSSRLRGGLCVVQHVGMEHGICFFCFWLLKLMVLNPTCFTLAWNNKWYVCFALDARMINQCLVYSLYRSTSLDPIVSLPVMTPTQTIMLVNYWYVVPSDKYLTTYIIRFLNHKWYSLLSTCLFRESSLEIDRHRLLPASTVIIMIIHHSSFASTKPYRALLIIIHHQEASLSCTAPCTHH